MTPVVERQRVIYCKYELFLTERKKKIRTMHVYVSRYNRFIIHLYYKKYDLDII